MACLAHDLEQFLILGVVVQDELPKFRCCFISVSLPIRHHRFDVERRLSECLAHPARKRGKLIGETNPDMAGTDEFNRSARIALPAYAAALDVRK